VVVCSSSSRSSSRQHLKGSNARSDKQTAVQAAAAAAAMTTGQVAPTGHSLAFVLHLPRGPCACLTYLCLFVCSPKQQVGVCRRFLPLQPQPLLLQLPPPRVLQVC
jgi:hypothetical protein